MPPSTFIHRGTALLDAFDVLLLQALRAGLPLTDTPYADLGAAVGLGEHDAIERLERLQDAGVIGAIGPLPHTHLGALPLAAIQVPEERLDAVAAQVEACQEVTQGVRREHRFNLWFGIACADTAAGNACCAEIERLTGLAVLCLPEERDYAPEWWLAA